MSLGRKQCGCGVVGGLYFVGHAVLRKEEGKWEVGRRREEKQEKEKEKRRKSWPGLAY